LAKFSKTDAVAYIDGVENSTNLNVGYLSGTNRVVRFPFSVGETGANEFSFLLADAYLNYTIDGVGDAEKFAFAVVPQDGTNYANHNGVDSGDIGDGTLVFESTGTANMYNISGSVKKTLLPGDYYLWLFPNYKSSKNSVNYRLWYGSNFVATYELSGAAGLVRIETVKGLVTAIPYIDNGVEWKQAIPYIDNGVEWDICG
jgi:hypothetical protein